MKEFFIDVDLIRGKTRMHVEETTTEDQAQHLILLYTIDFYNGKDFTTLTLQLEEGKWFDRNTQLSEDDHYLSYDLGGDAWNPDYKSPLSQRDIDEVGLAIAKLMVLLLMRQMSLFTPVLPSPKFN